MRVDDALLPDGTVAKREIVEHPGGVCVAALTENNELMFVEQFRYPYAEVVLELPAGKLEKDEDGEDILVTVDDDDEFDRVSDIFEDEFFSDIDHD